MKCDLCEEHEAVEFYTDQSVCEKCDNSYDYLYCYRCDRLIAEDEIEWFSDTARCSCGSKMDM